MSQAPEEVRTAKSAKDAKPEFSGSEPERELLAVSPECLVSQTQKISSSFGGFGVFGGSRTVHIN
jgi:hypothetical protein